MTEPATGEWVAAAVAAALVVLLGGFLLLRPFLRRSTATAWGRAGALAMAATAVGVLLVVVVTGVAGWRADDRPAGPFAAELTGADVATTERTAAYVAALGLPVVAVLVVLAVSIVDVPRPTGLRIAAAVAAGVVLAVGTMVAAGDTGSAASAAGFGMASLSGAAALAIAVDEITVGSGRPRRRPRR